VKPGDLVQIEKHGAFGIVTEVFSDLDPQEPWVRVLFTYPSKTYQWCKKSGLRVLKKEGEQNTPLLGDDNSGSL